MYARDQALQLTIHAPPPKWMEVIYTGLRQTPEQIAAAAAQEVVDGVGL